MSSRVTCRMAGSPSLSRAKRTRARNRNAVIASNARRVFRSSASSKRRSSASVTGTSDRAPSSPTAHETELSGKSGGGRTRLGRRRFRIGQARVQPLHKCRQDPARRREAQPAGMVEPAVPLAEPAGRARSVSIPCPCRPFRTTPPSPPRPDACRSACPRDWEPGPGSGARHR